MNTRSSIRAALSSVVVALVALLFMSTPAMAILEEELVEYWEFDGNYDAEIDATHAGTLVTAAPSTGSFVPGKFGQAIDLENADENLGIAYVRVGGDENDFDFEDQDMSISLWYTTQSLYHWWLTLIAKGEGDSWRLARNNLSETDLNFRGVTGDGKLDQQDGSWHHVAATSSTVNGTQLYIDGTLVAANADPVSFLGNDQPLFIGNNPERDNRGWDGNIDDVGLWGRVLTANEVDLIWNEGIGDSIASLLVQTPNLLTLQVNTITGGLSIFGDATRTNDVDFYDIASPGNSLDDAGWNSLADQDFDGSGPPNGTGDGWEEVGHVGSSLLAEGFLQGSSTIGVGASVGLGDGYDTVVGAKDLVFTYRTDRGLVTEGLVQYVDLPGDFDLDGDVDGADLLLWQRDPGVGALGDWQDNFGTVAPPQAAAASAVPEPASLVLIGLGGLMLLHRRRA